MTRKISIKADEFNKRYLLLICFISAIGGFLFGFDTAVISGALPFVVHQLHLDVMMEGWFVSSALFGCIIGVAFAGKVTDMYGRKKIMILSSILFALSALGCMMAPGAFILISARLIGGIGIGVASMICPLYISEFSPPSFRGRMVTLYQLAITIGIVAAYFSNAWLFRISPDAGLSGWLRFVLVTEKWRGMIGLGIIPSIIFLFCLFIVPESPRWLLLKGQHQRAMEYLLKVNSRSASEREVAAVLNSLKEENGSAIRLFSPIFRRALLIGIALPFFAQASGINAVIYYGPSILNKAGFAMGNAFGGQVIIGIVNVLFTLVAIVTVDRWGRKPLLLFGIGGAVAALVVIGMLFKSGITEGPWILVVILLFTACFSFSFGPVCWIILGEIFPNAIRGRAMSLATISLWAACFIISQLTPWMLKSAFWGPAATFWTFAALCVPSIWMTLKYIPETKGRSLEEIELYWKSMANEKLKI
jgi:SP family arabinose:H+ symporter-like MFS transporter